MSIIDRVSAAGLKKAFEAFAAEWNEEPLDEEGSNDGVLWSSATNVSEEVEATAERPNERDGGMLALLEVAAVPNESTAIAFLCW